MAYKAFPDTSVFKILTEVCNKTPGFSNPEELFALYNLCLSTKNIPGYILEIGAWCGRSTVALGLAAKLIGNTKVISIDPFPEKTDWYKNKDGSYSFAVKIGDKEIKSYNEQTVFAEPWEKLIGKIYENGNTPLKIHSEQVKNYNLEDVVITVRGTTDEIPEKILNNLKLKLAFIDGDHSFNAVSNDINFFTKYSSQGSWVCLDDAFTGYEGVDKPIENIITRDKNNFIMAHRLTRKIFVAQKT